MKTFLVSLSLVILFAFAHTTSLAQCPTDYTCPWTAGPNPVTVYILNPTTNPVSYCEAKVYYCYRICGGGYNTYISSIEFVDVNCAIGIQVDDKYVFETALAGIYTANPWGGFTYPYSAPPCSTNVGYTKELYLASCWQTRIADGRAFIEQCTSVYGCVASYKVCWDYSVSPAKLIVLYDAPISTVNLCEDESETPWIISLTPHPCTSFCPH